MPEALDAARRALEEERAELQDRLARIEQALRSLPGTVAPGPRRSARRAGVARAPRGAVSEAVAAVLEDHGRTALHGDAIVAAVQERGVPTTKASVMNTLQRLQRQGRARNVGKNRWRRIRS